jgi:hypothetical protein
MPVAARDAAVATQGLECNVIAAVAPLLLRRVASFALPTKLLMGLRRRDAQLKTLVTNASPAATAAVYQRHQDHAGAKVVTAGGAKRAPRAEPVLTIRLIALVLPLILTLTLTLDPVDPCAGTCSTITVCGDQPDPVCPSKNSCRQSGDITVGSQNCRLFEQCDKSDVPAECGFCDCNCDNDCPDCQVCNSSGVCVPDPSCDNTVAGVPIQCGGSYCGGVAYTGTGCEVNPTSHVQTPGSDPCDPVSGFGYFKEGTLTIEKVRQVPLPNGSFTYEWRVAGQKYNPLGGGSFAYSSVKPLGLESPVVTGNADIVTGVGGGNCAPDCGGGSDPDPGEGNCDEGYSACGDLETCCPPGTGCQEYGTSTLSNGGEYPTSGSAVIRYDQRTLSCNGTQGGPGVYPREMASIMNYSGGSGVIHIAQDNAGPACGSGGNSTVTLSGYVRNGYSCV